MAATKRTKEQRQLDLAETAKLLRRGWSKTQIAAKLGIHRTQVLYDWKQLLKKLRADRDKDVEAKVTAKLEEYREVKQEAWDAWERSKQDKERETKKKVAAGTGGDATERLEAVKQTEGRLPANEYLNTVLKCFEAERELEGINPPEKHEHTVTLDERRTRLASVLTALRERAGTNGDRTAFDGISGGDN